MKDKLTPSLVYKILKNHFPKQNDFNECDYKEELNELVLFGIKTKEDLDSLIVKHKDDVLEIDSEPLDEQHKKWYRDSGIEDLENKISNDFWFALPGLLRITLELEFGEKYQQFANKRDGIT